jgi:hypothetical protein
MTSNPRERDGASLPGMVYAYPKPIEEDEEEEDEDVKFGEFEDEYGKSHSALHPSWLSSLTLDCPLRFVIVC